MSVFLGLACQACSLAETSSRAAAEDSAYKLDGGVVAVCPRVLPTTREGRVADNQVDELSGAIASHKNKGVFWVHNDSGDDARAFAVDLRGRALARLTLRNIDADDIEDIALARGQGDKPDVLYLADTGDNWQRRKKVHLYRVEEPRLDLAREHVELERDAQELDIVYEDGKHDAETLLIDPRSGDVYLVVKSHHYLSEEAVGVYRLAAADLRSTRQVVARKVASIPLGPATGGDIAPDGSGIVVRSYWSALYWARAAGESIAHALQKPGCRLPVSDVTHQGESIAFSADGKAYVTIPEGSHPQIYRYAFAP